MRNLKSKETYDYVTAIWYKHDFMGLRRMGFPKNEYDLEARKFLYRLRFRRFLRGNYEYTFKSFTFEEVLEELCRTIDDFEGDDGSVNPMFKPEKETKKIKHIGYSSPKLNPVERDKYKSFAQDLYDYIVDEKEISLDTSKVDEKYCNFLRNKIKESIEEQGYTWSEAGLDGPWSLDNMNRRELNEVLWLIDPDPILVKRSKNRIDEDKED